MFPTIISSNDAMKDNFYSPISLNGYLTPLQRKKLREKRNSNVSSIIKEEFVTPKNKKKVKKTKQRNIKDHPRVKNSKEVHHKKVKENFPGKIRITSDRLLQKNANDFKEKKFFKSRSPQHLKKSSYVVSLKCKKRRLDFNDPNPRDSTSFIKGKKNETSENSNVISSDATNFLEAEDLNISSLIKTSQSPKYVTERISFTSRRKPGNMANKQFCEDFNFEFHWPSDEYLLERQNKARAEIKLAKSAPMMDVSVDEKNVEQSHYDNGSPPKLFSIFTNPKNLNKNEDEERKCAVKRSNLKKNSPRGKKAKDDDQMIIDAGQKEIGAKICQTCNMLYFLGQEEDERLHSNYHDTYLTNLRFPGWKNENVVGQYADGRIILIKESDKNFKLKKVQDVLFIANRDLGFPTAGFPTRPNIMFLLFISNEKRVSGCLVAESITSACPVVTGEASEEDKKTVWKLGNWYASSKPLPAMCGVNRIWVSKDFRRRRVASRMVDCLRQYFIYGHIVSLAEIAFTDPSPDGREFAASYTKTNNFLVYK